MENAPEPFPSLLDEDPTDLYEDAPCGYLSVLPDGLVARVNRTFLAWTGYRPGEVLGRRLLDLYRTGSRIYHETHLKPLLHMQGEVREVAVEFRTADGGRLDALVNVVLRQHLDTGAMVTRMTVFNATDRRRYERELLAERRRAELNAARVRVLQEMVVRCATVELPEQVTGPVAAAGAEAFGATAATLWLLDGARGVLATTGGAATREVDLDDAGPEARAVRDGDVVVTGPADPDDPVAGVRVVAPLIADERTVGVVSFHFAGIRDFDADEIALLRTVGRQAGQAVERARLFEQTARYSWQTSFLARLGRDLDEAVGSVERARRLVALLVPDLVEYAQVDMRHPERSGWLAASADPDGEAITSGPDGPWPIPAEVRATVAEVSQSGQATPVPLAAPDGRRALVLPLRARGAVIGTLLLVGGSAGERLDAGFLLDLADRAGLALDNAQLAEQDRRVALTLQRSMLSSERLGDPRCHVATVYRPATETLEVGGDWYDAFRTSGSTIGVVVGDVVGRGIQAASAMGQLRSAVRALAKAHCGPARLLGHMDDFAATLETGQMTTLAYAELALDTGQLRYACAGHLPPLLLSPGAAPRYLWDGRSGPLHTRAANRLRREAELTVPQGARLLLYTDGLVERRGERIDQGLERLVGALDGWGDVPLATLVKQVSEELLADESGRDDTCLLALAFDGAPRFDRQVPSRMSELATLRAELGRWLTDVGLTETERFGIVLACNEAVANAIEHGYRRDPDRTVSVSAVVADARVDIRVSDTGAWRTPRASSDRGRGMALMGRVMDSLIVDRGEGTTVVMSRQFEGITR